MKILPIIIALVLIGVLAPSILPIIVTAFMTASIAVKGGIIVCGVLAPFVVGAVLQS